MTESTKIDYVSIVQDLRDEADLCRNETATDIADLLDDAASCIVAMKSQFVALRADLAAAQEALKNHLHLDNHNAIVRQLEERAQAAEDQVERLLLDSEGAHAAITALKDDLQRAEERAERNARDAERKDGLLRECAYFMASFSEDCCIASSNLRQSCEHESAAIAGEGK